MSLSSQAFGDDYMQEAAERERKLSSEVERMREEHAKELARYSSGYVTRVHYEQALDRETTLRSQVATLEADNERLRDEVGHVTDDEAWRALNAIEPNLRGGEVEVSTLRKALRGLYRLRAQLAATPDLSAIEAEVQRMRRTARTCEGSAEENVLDFADAIEQALTTIRASQPKAVDLGPARRALAQLHGRTSLGWVSRCANDISQVLDDIEALDLARKGGGS